MKDKKRQSLLHSRKVRIETLSALLFNNTHIFHKKIDINSLYTITMSHTKITLGLFSIVGSVLGFQPSSYTTTLTPRTSLPQFSSSSSSLSKSTATATTTTTTQLQVAVDPTVITKKEYQDICGVSFDHETLEQRLTRTNFLYPKHVEVVEEIAPIAGAMVDEIVRSLVISV